MRSRWFIALGNAVSLSAGFLPASFSAGCSWVAGVEGHEGYPTDAAADALAESAADSGAEAATLAGDAGIDAADGSADATWGRTESCNLLDDDYDGVVDEGFDWSIGEWQKLATLSGGRSVKTARLSDGTVMVLMEEQTAPGLTRLSLARVDSDGTPSLEVPLEVAPARKISGYGIARTFDDEVGVAYVEADDEQCAQGCPLRLSRYRDGALVQSEVVTIEVPGDGAVTVSSLFDLGTTTAGYVFLLADEKGQARINWRDQRFVGNPFWKGYLTGIRPNAGSLSSSGMLAWELGGKNDSDQQTLMFGVTTPGGYRQTLMPKEPVPVGGGAYITVHPGGRAIAWLGTDIVVGYTNHVLGEASPHLGWSDGSGVQKGSVKVASSGEFHSIAGFRGGLLGSSIDKGLVSLQRLDSQLKKVGQATSFDDAAAHAFVSDGGDPMIVRISEDGSAAWVAAPGCP